MMIDLAYYKLYPLQHVITITDVKSPKVKKYIFVDEKPIDIRNEIYKFWGNLYKQNKDICCFGCGRKATNFIMERCNGDGSLHKETGVTKHHFRLISKNKDTAMAFTRDHWYPNSFVIALNTFGYTLKNNLVPMCSHCNSMKKNIIPKNGKWGVSNYIPKFERL